MPEDDLYRILGVDKNADKSTIKKAYRKASKKTHPDIPGGSPKKFALVKKSFDILYDDRRRKKYDETGDDSEKSPDNAQGDAVNFIAFAFNQVLAKCAESGESPLEINMVNKVISEINKNIAESEKQIRISKGMLDVDQKLSGRFTHDKDSVFENIISHRITQLRANISNMEKSVVSGNAAKDLIKDCQFKEDNKPYESPGDAMMRRMGAISYVKY